MLSDLFFQVLLVIYCTLFVSAHYASGNTDQTAVQKGVELFKTTGKEISKIFDTEGNLNSGSIEPTDFYSPFLVATDNVIVALAGVNSTSSSGNEINVLARHVEIKGSDWLTKATNNDGIDTNWQKQFAVKKDWKNKTKLKFILAAAQKNNIYLLLVNDTEQAAISDESGATTQCDYCIIFGTVSKSETLKIEWQDKAPLKDNEKLKQQLDQNLNKIPSNGYVLFEEKEKLLFALEFDNSDGKKKTFCVY